MRQLLLLVVLPGLATGLSAEPPARVTNAKLETRSAASGLAPVVKAVLAARSGPAWIGWSVPASAADSSCCWSSEGSGPSCRGCRLEGKGGFDATGDDPTKLEGSDRLRVLLRAEAGQVGKIRTFSEDCPVDAGGLPLVWLEDVRPAESVALLVSFVGQPRDGAKGGKRLDDGALAAIAFHADPGAVDTIIEVARRDPDAHVRGQALFWLSQTAARRAPEAIRAALDDDPEVEVKKKAVFALSQLPKDEGVPLLIGVARTHQSYEVRKQAMFWLGQSQDTRALAFFEDVLKR